MLLFYWLYIWQLKEYRLDRLVVHLRSLSRKDLLKEFFWGKWRRPKATAKIVLITVVVFLVGVLLFYGGAKGLSSSLDGKRSRLTSVFLLVGLWSVQPLVVFLVVLLFQIPTKIAKEILIFFAVRKVASFPNLTVIGITGSFGKTSTKEFLATILSKKFKVLKTTRSVNTDIGIALTILKRLTAEHEVFVVEMGAYRKGEIKEICGMVKPKIGILTGINKQHLSLFGSIENTKAAKFELIESLPRNGLAILNGDNKYCLELSARIRIAKKLYSTEKQTGVWANNILQEKGILRFEVFNEELKVEFAVELLGKQNVPNILAATAVALELGMTLPEIARAAEKIEPPTGTMKLISGINGSIIIDDTFSSNPDGFWTALKALQNFPAKEKILIATGIIELGVESVKIHQEIGEKVARVCDLVIVTNKNAFRKFDKKQFVLIEKPDEIIEMLKERLGGKTVVLLEGRMPTLISAKCNPPAGGAKPGVKFKT